MTAKPRVKIAFRDFYIKFDPRDNFISRLLEPHFELELSDDPDFTIFSVWGQQHLLDRSTRIFFSVENRSWSFKDCDYAFTSDLCDDERHYRIPPFVIALPDPTTLVKTDIDAESLLREKTAFCNFVYSNPVPKTRTRFFKELSRYKHVDSAGRHLNNLGEPVGDKRSFLGRYKFTIAFENSSFPGYTSEKLTDPMQANSIPIYWGNELVHLDFNPKSFINAHDFADFDQVIEHVIECDRDDDLYMSYVREPWFHGNVVSDSAWPEGVFQRFVEIFDRPPIRHHGLTPREKVRLAGWWVIRPAFQKLWAAVVARQRLHKIARFVWRNSQLAALYRRLDNRYLHRGKS